MATIVSHGHNGRHLAGIVAQPIEEGGLSSAIPQRDDVHRTPIVCCRRMGGSGENAERFILPQLTLQGEAHIVLPPRASERVSPISWLCVSGELICYERFSQRYNAKSPLQCEGRMCCPEVPATESFASGKEVINGQPQTRHLLRAQRLT